MTIIGITLDWDDSPTYSSMHPWYALRCNYASVISKFKSTPIIIPYDFASINKYVNMIDGLMIPGGDYDLDPSVYGEEKAQETRNTRNIRSDFEIKLIKEVIAQNKPLLGICAGEQLLAAIYGGKLIQDIKSYNPNSLEHEQRKLNIHMSKPSHKVKITPNTLLHKILETDEIEVNSSHHQAVKSVGKEMVISGVAPDGIIEAIEMPNRKFVIGIEWHPEYLVSQADEKLIQSFIKAASNK